MGSGLGLCGFCAFGGNHELCPSGVVSMTGEKVWRCGCGCEQSLQVKCLSCGLRELEYPAEADRDIDSATWRCKDLDACMMRTELRLASNPTVQMIRSINESNGDRVESPRLPRVGSRPAARPKSGQCLHCGEPTKGGLFLPGHDAAWVSHLVKEVGLGTTPDAIAEMMTSKGCSPVLVAKFRKKAEAL